MKFDVQGSGMPVLLLHGIPTSGRLWDRVVPELQRSFSCVVVDLPGFGDSPPRPDASLDPEDYAEELDILREQLGIGSWHVVGHDAGATVAVHYAAKFSDRTNRLVLCSPPVFPDLQVPELFRLLRIPGLGECIAPLACWILLPIALRSKIARGDGTKEIVGAFCRPFSGLRGPGRLLHILRWGDPRIVLARTAALLSKIEAPTLIIHGREDGAIPLDFARRARDLVPDSELLVLDCGHFVPLNCPEPFASSLMGFLGEGSMRARKGA